MLLFLFMYYYKEISLMALVNYNNRHSCGVTSLRKKYYFYLLINFVMTISKTINSII